MISKKNVILLIVFGLFFRLSYALIIPPLAGNDEPAHYRYIQHIISENRLPNGKLYLNENLIGNEYVQPPIYYFLGSLVAKLAINNPNQLYFVRIFSISLWLLTFYFTLKILSLIRASIPVSISVLSLITLIPTFVVNSSTITNDSLVVPFCCGLLYFILLKISRDDVNKNLLKLAFFSSLALLAKYNATVIIFVIIYAFYISRKNLNGFIIRSFSYLGIIFLFTSWWFFYNMLTYHNILGPAKEAAAVSFKLPFSYLKYYLIFRGVFSTFWAAYGQVNEIRLHISNYLIIFITSVLSLIGFLKLYCNEDTVFTIRKKYLDIFIASIVFNIIFVLIYNINQHQPLGRFLFISIIPIATLFTLGIEKIMPKKFTIYLPSLLTIFLIILNIQGIIKLINYYY